MKKYQVDFANFVPPRCKLLAAEYLSTSNHLHHPYFDQISMATAQTTALFKHVLVVGANRGIGLGLVREAVSLVRV